MDKSNTSQQLGQSWEDAVAQASANAARQEPLGKERLNTVAGLAVASGIRAGVWGVSESCSCSCTCASTCSAYCVG